MNTKQTLEKNTCILVNKLYNLAKFIQDHVYLSFCFFFACGKKTYSQCEKTKNLELVLFSPFTSDTRYMCAAKNSS